MGLLFTLTRSGRSYCPVCSTAMTCRVSRTNNELESRFRDTTAACCGRRAKQAHTAYGCNAKVRGNSCHGPDRAQLLEVVCANPSGGVSAGKAALCEHRQRFRMQSRSLKQTQTNLINCVRSGRCCKLQARVTFALLRPMANVVKETQHPLLSSHRKWWMRRCESQRTWRLRERGDSR